MLFCAAILTGCDEKLETPVTDAIKARKAQSKKDKQEKTEQESHGPGNEETKSSDLKDETNHAKKQTTSDKLKNLGRKVVSLKKSVQEASRKLVK